MKEKKSEHYSRYDLRGANGVQRALNSFVYEHHLLNNHKSTYARSSKTSIRV